MRDVEKNETTHEDSVEEFDFESEVIDGGALEKASERVRKLKAELHACKTQAQEYLDGWQRLRADIANQKKDERSLYDRIAETERERMLQELLPVLDAFDMATGSEGWHVVDSTWRTGIEHIRTTLRNVLAQNGIEPYGKKGDAFDPALHEALHAEGGQDTVEKVVRTGYRQNGRVLRPAQVITS